MAPRSAVLLRARVPGGTRVEKRVEGHLGDMELISQGATSVSPLEAVGSSAGGLRDFPVTTKMGCATLVLRAVHGPGWA